MAASGFPFCCDRRRCPSWNANWHADNSPCKSWRACCALKRSVSPQVRRTNFLISIRRPIGKWPGNDGLVVRGVKPVTFVAPNHLVDLSEFVKNELIFQAALLAWTAA